MGERGDVAGTLPRERTDFGGDAGPFEMGGKKVREPGLFMKSFGEVGFEKRKRARVGAAEHIDRGGDEELKSNHGGDGIPREAEDEGIAAAAEDGRLAGADGDGVKIKFGP